MEERSCHYFHAVIYPENPRKLSQKLLELIRLTQKNGFSKYQQYHLKVQWKWESHHKKKINYNNKTKDAKE